MINKILDYFDNKKKNKALNNYPWRYKDRHGNYWFNTDYRCDYDKFRKWC